MNFRGTLAGILFGLCLPFDGALAAELPTRAHGPLVTYVLICDFGGVWVADFPHAQNCLGQDTGNIKAVLNLPGKMETLLGLDKTVPLKPSSDWFGQTNDIPMEKPCQLLETRSFSAVIRDKSDQLQDYLLSSRSNDWKIEGFGYHGLAMIGCLNCQKDGQAEAQVWMFAATGEVQRPQDKSGQTYTQEFRTWYELPFDHAEYKGAPQAIAFGGLHGWAIRIEASSKGKVTHDIVHALASDGCASLRLLIQASPSNTDNFSGAVTELLASIEITRLLSSESLR